MTTISLDDDARTTHEPDTHAATTLAVFEKNNLQLVHDVFVALDELSARATSAAACAHLDVIRAELEDLSVLVAHTSTAEDRS